MLFYVFAGATGIAAALASIAIWAPRPTRVRVAALVIAMFFIPVVYVQSIEMLSKPKPMSFEWYERNEAKAVLIGITLDEGKAIYMWLQLPGSPEPRNYEVPWNLRLAENWRTPSMTLSGGIRQLCSTTPSSREASRNGAILMWRLFRPHWRR